MPSRDWCDLVEEFEAPGYPTEDLRRAKESLLLAGEPVEGLLASGMLGREPTGALIYLDARVGGVWRIFSHGSGAWWEESPYVAATLEARRLAAAST